MRAGLIVKHQSGKAWGHQGFEVFLKGKPDPYSAKFSCRQSRMASQKAVFFGVRRSGSRLSRWDLTIPSRGFVNVAQAACMWMTSKKEALSGMPWASCDLDTIVSNYNFI